MTSPRASTRTERDTWSRLDPRMLLVHPVMTVIRFLPVLIGVFLIGAGSDDGHYLRELIMLAIPVAIGIAQYFTTRYRIDDERLELRRGLLTKKTLTARLERIRTVEVAASPIHRLLGLTKVKISTAHAGSGDDVVLDALPRRRAAALRAELLHSSREPAAHLSAPVTGTAVPGVPPSLAVPGSMTPGQQTAERGSEATVAAPGAVGAGIGTDEALLLMRPGWIRYAPLTASGLTAAAAIAAVTGRFTGAAAEWVVDHAEGSPLLSLPVPLIATAAGVVALIAVSLLAVIGYLLNYWHFTLSKDTAGRSLHISRGLATTHQTSVELARVRGAELHEPWGLRCARAARLSALATGISRGEGGAVPLVPPAPRASSLGVATRVLGTPAPFTAPLRPHGPRATVRRYSRAAIASIVVMAAVATAVFADGLDPALILLGLIAPLLALPMAWDRARRLGHTVVDGYVVSRAHCLRGRRSALAIDGIIGWTVKASLFQRRAGLVTMTATTAAGSQGYPVIDVPETMAAELINETTPDLAAILLPAIDGDRDLSM